MDTNTSPEHPANPQWQTFQEWVKLKQPNSVQYVKSAEEAQQDAFERFGLKQEDGSGWGDPTGAQDAGWGTKTENLGGW